MSQIILPSGSGPPLPSSYSDDSYRSGDANAPIVVARILSGVDLRWHKDVVEKLARRSRELKASRVLNSLNELPVDLQRAIKSTIREARISILDPKAYTLEFDRLLAQAIGQGIATEVRERFRRRFLADYIRDGVILDSPAWRVQRMLFPEPLFDLSEVYGIDTARHDDDGLFRELRKKLQKPHSVLLFGARSTAAFAELMDPEERSKVLKNRAETGDWLVRNPDIDVFLKHRGTSHVFDEGNRPTVDAIRFLRDSADRAAQRQERVPLVLLNAGETTEKSSLASPELQAADLAAGYARRLYESQDGLKKVCLEFRQVLLNGSLVRDWTPRW